MEQNYITFLEKCRHLEPPIDIESMVHNMWIQTYYDAFRSFNGFTLLDNTGICIMINDTLSKQKQRFTLAHELKHCIENEMAFHGKNKGSQERIEQEANWFAGKLLVPDIALEYFYYNKTSNIAELADVFWVTEQTIEIRLKEIWIL